MSRAGMGEPRTRAPRSERCVSWFSAVVLFMLLSAASDPAATGASPAHNRIEIRSERHAYEATRALSGRIQIAPCCESVAPLRLEHLPWSHSVIEHGLPLPRAPTA